MLSEQRLAEIAARLARMVTINPLPWSGIAASYIRNARRLVIVSAQELTDSEADYLRESAQDLTDLLAEVQRLRTQVATLEAQLTDGARLPTVADPPGTLLGYAKFIAGRHRPPRPYPIDETDDAE